MRLATLGINFTLVLASFALGLGVGLGRSPLARSVAGERELVSGAGAREAQPAAPSTPEAATAGAATPEAAAPEAAAAREAPAAQPAASAAGAPRAHGPSRALKQRSAAPEPPELTWSAIAARAQSWTAAVRADQNYGAGLVVDRSGLIFTNLHVVAGARSITVTPFGSTPSAAHVIDSDAELDLALLGVSLPAPLEAAAELGSSTALSVGDEVLAVGSPRKMYYSVSRGMVSFPNRLLEGIEYVQTDLPINEGNSGGPLVDRKGSVVGIVSFILKESQGLSFALPIDRALARFAPQLGGARPAPPAALTVQRSERPARALGGSPAGEPPPIPAHLARSPAH